MDKKLNINYFWDLSFLICNVVFWKLPNYINNSFFFELGKNSTEKIIKCKVFIFKNVIVLTFEQNATAGPSPLVHDNPNKMYTKPIEYEYKTYGRQK